MLILFNSVTQKVVTKSIPYLTHFSSKLRKNQIILHITTLIIMRNINKSSRLKEILQFFQFSEKVTALHIQYTFQLD